MSHTHRAETPNDLSLTRSIRAERASLLKTLDAEYKRYSESESLPSTVVVGSTSTLRGEVTAPPSKSYSHRALMVAGLCTQHVEIENALIARDIIATADAWTCLGASIQFDRGVFSVGGVSRPSPESEIFVRESGTTLRFLLPGLAFANSTVMVKGKGSLRSRSNSMIVEPLRDLGLKIQGQGHLHHVPIQVVGTGSLPTGDILLKGDQSSQVVSSLLLWLSLASPKGLFARKSSSIQIVGNLVSKPYVDITIDMLNWAGIRVQETEAGYRVPANQQFRASSDVYRVHGDYSSAAFVLAAACITNSNVLVRDLVADKQGDRRIVDILRSMGARLEIGADSIRVVGPSRLRGVELDCSDIPDLVPILCVLGTFAEGRMVLKNIAHLRHKESDRLRAPAEELSKLGARISSSHDAVVIEQSSLRFAEVQSHGDHRIAMSLMVAALAAKGAQVSGIHCIGKSFPSFVREMRSLGADIR